MGLAELALRQCRKRKVQPNNPQLNAPPSVRPSTGSCYRVITRPSVVDEFARKCLELRETRLLKGMGFLGSCSRLIGERGALSRIRSSNGSGFIAQKVKNWVKSLGGAVQRPRSALAKRLCATLLQMAARCVPGDEPLQQFGRGDGRSLARDGVARGGRTVGVDSSCSLVPERRSTRIRPYVAHSARRAGLGNFPIQLCRYGLKPPSFMG